MLSLGMGTLTLFSYTQAGDGEVAVAGGPAAQAVALWGQVQELQRCSSLLRWGFYPPKQNPSHPARLRRERENRSQRVSGSEEGSFPSQLLQSEGRQARPGL